jgi:hypothetical protein
MTTEKSLLDHGEKLIWSGKPSAVWFAIRRMLWLLPIAFVFLLISLNLFVVFGRPPVPPQPMDKDTLHRVMFIRGLQEMGVFAGICALLAGLWLWLRAFRTTYLLTNRRIVINTVGVLPRRTSMPLEHIRFIEFRSKLLGPDDLVFNETRRLSLDGWGLRGEGFIAIPDANRVERLVRDAIDQTFATRTRGPWQ